MVIDIVTVLMPISVVISFYIAPALEIVIASDRNFSKAVTTIITIEIFLTIVFFLPIRIYSPCNRTYCLFALRSVTLM